MILQELSCEPAHGAADRGDELEDIGAADFRHYPALDSFHWPPGIRDARQEVPPVRESCESWGFSPDII